MSNPLDKLSKAILEDSTGIVVSDAQVRAGLQFVEQVDQLTGIDDASDLDETFVRALYTTMRGLEGAPTGELAAALKARGGKRAATAEAMQAQELRVREIDYPLVAEMIKQQVEDLNAAMELIFTMGVSVAIENDPLEKSGGATVVHYDMFGRPRVGKERRAYPRLKVKMIKKEVL